MRTAKKDKGNGAESQVSLTNLMGGGVAKPIQSSRRLEKQGKMPYRRTARPLESRGAWWGAEKAANRTFRPAERQKCKLGVEVLERKASHNDNRCYKRGRKGRAAEGRKKKGVGVRCSVRVYRGPRRKKKKRGGSGGSPQTADITSSGNGERLYHRVQNLGEEGPWDPPRKTQQAKREANYYVQS